eukprot:scaffold13.g256.t1
MRTLLLAVLALALARAAPSRAQQSLPFPIHVDTTGGTLGVLGATAVPAASYDPATQPAVLGAPETNDTKAYALSAPEAPAPAEDELEPVAPAPTTDEPEPVAITEPPAEAEDTAPLPGDSNGDKAPAAAVTPTVKGNGTRSDALAEAGLTPATTDTIASELAAADEPPPEDSGARGGVSVAAVGTTLTASIVASSAQEAASQGRAEPSIGSDTAAKRLLVTWSEGGAAVYAYSDNGGATWTAPKALPVPPGYASLQAPRVEGPAGGLYFVTAQAVAPAGNASSLAVLAGVAAAGGFRWTRIVALRAPGACLLWQRPSLAAAADTSMLVLAAQEVSSAASAACRRMPEVSRVVSWVSRDKGATWSDTITLVDRWVLPANRSYAVATSAPAAVVANATTASVFFALSARDYTSPTAAPQDSLVSTAWLAMVQTKNKGESIGGLGGAGHAAGQGVLPGVLRSTWSAPKVLLSFNSPQLATPAGYNAMLLPISPAAAATKQALYVAFTTAVAPVAAGLAPVNCGAALAAAKAVCFGPVATSTAIQNVKQFMPSLAKDTTSPSGVAVSYYQSTETATGAACTKRVPSTNYYRSSPLTSLGTTNLCSLGSALSPALGLGTTGSAARVLAAFTDGASAKPRLRFTASASSAPLPASPPPPPPPTAPQKDPPTAGSVNILSTGRAGCWNMVSVPQPCSFTFVDTYGSDDGSGAQRWVLKPVAGKAATYTVQVQARTAACGQFLSATAACASTQVELRPRDASGALQEWQVVHQGNNVFTLTVGGRPGCTAAVLTATPCSAASRALALGPAAAGNALQQFKFSELPPPVVDGIYSTMFTALNTTGRSGLRGAGAYANPLMPGNFFADPGVLRAPNGLYYMYATPVGTCWESPDLVNWAPRGPGFGAGPGMGAGEFWAPEIYLKNGVYYLFYTAVAPGSGHFIYVARAANPCGPWQYHAGPLTDPGMLDPHYFRDDNGKEYLYASGIGVGIWMWDLSPDLTTVSNKQFVFSHASMPEAWVPEIINEGPIMLKRRGTYYLVYSGNGCCNNILYGLGYATAPTPRGPWSKSKYNPILWYTANTVGTGHNAFAMSPSGNLVTIYHIINGMSTTDDRRLAIDLAEFVPDPAGGPDILKIHGPTRTPQAAP